jgi:hypothetical protein
VKRGPREAAPRSRLQQGAAFMFRNSLAAALAAGALVIFAFGVGI